MKKYEDIKASLQRSNNSRYIFSTWTDLATKYKEINDSDLLEYVPVKIVSCTEEYLRQLYKDIIDTPKYRKNIKKLKCLKDCRYDFDVIDAFQNREITLGDYLSYHLPCSSVNQIIEHFETMLIDNFREQLIKQIIEIKEEDSSDEYESKNANQLLQTIDDTFKTRHILCHEGLPTISIDNVSAMQMINDSHTFIKAIDKLVSDSLYGPEEFLTQAKMNNIACNDFEEAEQELEEVIKGIKEKDENYMANFEYIIAWKKYREKRAESEASVCEGGSMYPCIYWGSMTNTTQQLINELKKEFRFTES